MRPTSRLLLVLSAASLTACGGARLGGGKEGAAQALYGASSNSQKAGNTWWGSPAVDFSFSQKASCPKGGEVKLTLSANLGDGTEVPVDGLFDFSTEFLDCSNDGQSRYKGKLDMDMTTRVDTAAESIEMVMGHKGRVDISGAVSDFLDADVRLITRVDIDSQGEAPSASVQLVMDGTITTSSGTYTYDNETLSVATTGSLPVAEE